jgi:hypothetical protein
MGQGLAKNCKVCGKRATYTKIIPGGCSTDIIVLKNKFYEFRDKEMKKGIYGPFLEKRKKDNYRAVACGRCLFKHEIDISSFRFWVDGVY